MQEYEQTLNVGIKARAVRLVITIQAPAVSESLVGGEQQTERKCDRCAILIDGVKIPGDFGVDQINEIISSGKQNQALDKIARSLRDLTVEDFVKTLRQMRQIPILTPK